MATVIFQQSPQNTGHCRQPFDPRRRLSLHLRLQYQVSLTFRSLSEESTRQMFSGSQSAKKYEQLLQISMNV